LRKQNEIPTIAEIKTGEHKAFEILFRELYPSLCVYAKKFTLQKEIAEEIVQQIFFKLWENRKDIDIHTSLKSYLFKAVHNNSLKYLNSKKFEEDYKKFNEEILLHKTDFLPDFELSEKINKSIDDLPPQCRKIFILSRFDNLKHAEIAEKLHISVKTVEVQIRRANIVLRKKLQEFVPVMFLLFLVRDFYSLMIL
jgi:RNA polymerase sigma-70 factor (ECF subfamily)